MIQSPFSTSSEAGFILFSAVLPAVFEKEKRGKGQFRMGSTVCDGIRFKLSKRLEISVQLVEISVPANDIWGTLIFANRTLI